MSKPLPARHHTAIWKRYVAALKRRGFLLIRLDKNTTWLADNAAALAATPAFSDVAIQFCVSVTVLFTLPL